MPAAGAVELLAHVLCHTLIEVSFAIGEFIFDGVGPSLREQRAAIELEQVLLDHAAHQVACINRVNPITEFALKPVAVQQGHEQLEILFLPIVRCGGQEKKMPGDRRKQLPQLMSFGSADFATPEGGAHLVRFIADNNVPVRGLQFFLYFFVTT